MDRERALQMIEVYRRAWETQDSRLVLTIFREDAVYHERVLGNPMRGHEEIRRYWDDRVGKTQANIHFRLLDFFIDGATVIAEWQAEFDDLADGVRKRIREVAIVETDGSLISSLREYWASEVVGSLPSRDVIDEQGGRS